MISSKMILKETITPGTVEVLVSITAFRYIERNGFDYADKDFFSFVQVEYVFYNGGFHEGT